MSERERIQAIWAPAEVPWSKWVKPVLFSFMDAEPPPARSGDSIAAAGAADAGGDAALVIDLAGAQGVFLAIEMARHGYRPVPLYNACPWGQNSGLMLDTSDVYRLLASTGSRRRFPPPVVDVVPVISALYHGAAALQGLVLGRDAPPAFLLDARRRGDRIHPAPGMFDNRSVTSCDDFPGAEVFKQQGIRRTIVIQQESVPGEDLAYVLRGWSKGGIEIMRQGYGQAWQPQTLPIPKASLLGRLRYRLWARFGLRRNEAGFGEVIPEGSGPLVGGRKR